MADKSSIRRLHENYNTLMVSLTKRADALNARVDDLGVKGHRALDANEALLKETEDAIHEMEDTHHQATNGGPPLEYSPGQPLPPGVTLNAEHPSDPPPPYDKNAVLVNR